MSVGLADRPLSNNITNARAGTQGLEKAGNTFFQIILVTAHRTDPAMQMDYSMTRGNLNLAAVDTMATHLAAYLAAYILILCFGFIHRLLHCLSERISNGRNPMKPKNANGVIQCLYLTIGTPP